MKKYNSVIRGQKGFSKKYKTLGESKHMRIPLTVYDKIKTVIDLLECIGDSKDIEMVNKILDNIIDGLHNVV